MDPTTIMASRAPLLRSDMQPRITDDSSDCAECARSRRREASADTSDYDPLLQSFEPPAHLPPTSPAGWTRIGKPANHAPLFIRLAYWIWRPILQEGTENLRYDITSVAQAISRFLAIWPVVLVTALTSVVNVLLSEGHAHYHRVSPDDLIASATASASASASSAPRGTHPAQQGHGHGQEHDTDDADVAGDGSRGIIDPGVSDNIALSTVRRHPSSPGVSLRPRFLCFVKDKDTSASASDGDDDDNDDDPGYETKNVSQYIAEHGENADTEFIFVSYTRMQFRVATEAKIDAYEYPDEATREANRRVAREDRARLTRWGIEAARAAGKRAFWLDFECVRDSDGVARSTSASDDVYHICDIVRAAHSMIIAIGAPASLRVAALASSIGGSSSGGPGGNYGGDDDPTPVLEHLSADKETLWLREWGSRLWTLPELLLCPNEHRIKLYVAGSSDEQQPVKTLAKRNFAERVWDDAASVKELVDHFEGSAILTPLQFIGAALRCFAARKTDQFSGGDIAYAIMGLLPRSQRPPVIRADSGFQAFARLSTSHDSGQFLERLFCLAPPPPPPLRGRECRAPWYETDDAWGAKLRDIDPACRILDVVDAQTVVLSGAHGATIQWDRLDALPLDVSARSVGWVRFATWFFFIVLPFLFVFFIGNFPWNAKGRLPGRPTTPEGPSSRVQGYHFLIVILPLALSSLIPIFLAFETVRSQARAQMSLIARFYGIEGRADAATVERYLFSFWHGRMREVDSGNSLPSQDLPTAPDEEERLEVESEGCSDRVFTLVDTLTMTVTHFRAENPPVAVFLCGQDRGGMQRALLCSYDPARESFCREMVLRMPSSVLDKMSRVDKFRFSPQPLDNQGVDGTTAVRREGQERTSSSSAVDLEMSDPEATRSEVRSGRQPAYARKADTLLLLLTVLVFPDPYARIGTAQLSDAYFSACLAAQLITLVTLPRTSLWLIITPVLVSKYFLCYFATGILFLGTVLKSDNSVGLVIVYVLKGLIRGIALPTAVAIIRSLYPSRAIAPRLLIFWTGGNWLAGPLLSLLWRAGMHTEVSNFAFTASFPYLILGLYAMLWQVRTYFRPETTIGGLVPRDWESWKMLPRVLASRVPKLLSIFFAFACASHSAGIVPRKLVMYSFAGSIPPVLIAVVLALWLSAKPKLRTPAIIASSLLPLVYLLFSMAAGVPKTQWPYRLLVQPADSVLPLLWALIAAKEATLDDFLAAMAMSMAGISIDALLTRGLMVFRSDLAYFLIALATPFLVGLVALYYRSGSDSGPVPTWRRYGRLWFSRHRGGNHPAVDYTGVPTDEDASSG